jgi:hypothetical protein
MPRRIGVLLFVIFLASSTNIAGKKKKPALPDFVVNAKTVLVLIDPQAGVSVNDPLANRNAQQDVEKAFLKWGRLSPVTSQETADLVIAIRKGSGKVAQNTIGGLPTNDRPITAESTGNTTRVGAQQGRDPGTGLPGGPQNTAPHPQAEIGGADDTFVVYDGHVDHPLLSPAVWRYTAPDALHGPEVPAVDKFRKAIEEAVKQQQQQSQP